MIKFTILNTRPKPSTAETEQVFLESGYKVINLPCITIEPTIDGKVKKKLQEITDQDIIIFTSQYAAINAFKLLPQFKLNNNAVVIAVGTKTAEYLEQLTSVDIWVPKQQNSHGVIDTIKGLRQLPSIKLITAPSGRTLIQDYAKNNGINLEQINVYKRVSPHVDEKKITSILSIKHLIVLVTSVTTLENLKNIIPTSQWNNFLKNKVVCASNRILNAAKKMGFSNGVNANSSNPKIMADSIANI